jgi:hypothetical protein
MTLTNWEEDLRREDPLLEDDHRCEDPLIDRNVGQPGPLRWDGSLGIGMQYGERKSITNPIQLLLVVTAIQKHEQMQYALLQSGLRHWTRIDLLNVHNPRWSLMHISRKITEFVWFRSVALHRMALYRLPLYRTCSDIRQPNTAFFLSTSHRIPWIFLTLIHTSGRHCDSSTPITHTCYGLLHSSASPSPALLLEGDPSWSCLLIVSRRFRWLFLFRIWVLPMVFRYKDKHSPRGSHIKAPVKLTDFVVLFVARHTSM